MARRVMLGPLMELSCSRSSDSLSLGSSSENGFSSVSLGAGSSRNVSYDIRSRFAETPTKSRISIDGLLEPAIASFLSPLLVSPVSNPASGRVPRPTLCTYAGLESVGQHIPTTEASGQLKPSVAIPTLHSHRHLPSFRPLTRSRLVCPTIVPSR